MSLVYHQESLNLFFQLKGSKLLVMCLKVASVTLLTACLNTEGKIEISGKVIDEYTKDKIGGRDIIVQGIIRNGNVFDTVYAGQLSTDSSGSFRYSLRKISNVHYYNFIIVGDSDYSFTQKLVGLRELKQNARYLVFTMIRLVDITIIINRNSKTTFPDTLSLYWRSNGIHGKNIFPWKINNYAKTVKFAGLTTGTELRWVGGNVNSTIRTRVYADKRTELMWDLDRNGKRKEIIDTITCRRNAANIFYFTY